MFLTAFKNVLVSFNPTMALSFWYIFSSKDFKSQINLQFSITSFVQPSKTSFAKLIWSLLVKVLKFLLHHANSVCCRNKGIYGMKSCLPYGTNVCVLDFRTHEYFLVFHFQQISRISSPKTFFRTVGMIQGFHHLQKYCDYIVNLAQSLLWEKINFLADVRKDTIYIIDISTAWKAQTKKPRVKFS